MKIRVSIVVAAVCVIVVVAAACGGDGNAPTGNGDGGTITVLAAASLTEAFTDLAGAFEAENPGVEVQLSFGPSDGLATQIIEGAPADVFASASPAWADAVETDGPGLQDRSDFVRNELIVITPTDDPASIASVEDLARRGVQLVLAAEDVPAGTYARELLENAGIAEEAIANVVSNEEDVKGVVQKVALGEADAGIVYATDITEEVAPDLRTVAIPDRVNVIATYPIGVVGDALQPELAAAFVGFVTGPAGRETLDGYGFLPP